MVDSTLDTSGSADAGLVTVSALSDADLDASVENMVESGDTGVGHFGVEQGWEGQDVFTAAIDALLGNSLIADAIAAGNNAGASARLVDSTLDSKGLATVEAMSQSEFDVTIFSDATSNAAAFTGATGASFGAVIASNRILSRAEATIKDSDGVGLVDIDSAGGVEVQASDTAELTATVQIAASSVTENTNFASDSDALGAQVRSPLIS